MARDKIVVGIDIGTYDTYTVIGLHNPDSSPIPQIMGIGRAPSAGVKRGMILNIEDTVASLKASIQEASSAASIKISSAMVSVGGNHISSFLSRGTVAVSRADGEIVSGDIERVLLAAQTVPLPQNKEVLHTIPNEFIVDGEGGLHDVSGMSGLRLETDALIVGVASSHLRNLERCLAECNVRVDGFVLSILAASHAVLSNRQKEIGVACLDIGAGTTDIAIFEEGEMIYTSVIPLGGDSITHDIAIGLRLKTEIAEKIKQEYGMAMMDESKNRDVIDVSEFDAKEQGVFARKIVSEVMEARLKEILEEVNKKLREAKKEQLLPGGIVLVGGSAKIPYLVDLCKRELRLPCCIGFPKEAESVLGSVDDPALAAALGLVFWQLDESNQQGPYSGAMPSLPSLSLKGNLTGHMSQVNKWFRAFLP